jgi:cell wall-associated NlpC family hydrolase
MLPKPKIVVSDLLGKQFDINGKGPDKYNCYNLCVVVCKRAGIDLPEKQPAEELAERSKSFTDSLENECIRLEKAEPYCFVMFRTHPPFVSHVGIVLEDCLKFIHIIEGRNVVIERLDHLIWKKRFAGFYRYTGKNNA